MRRLIPHCAVAALLLAVATAAGCGNDDNPSGTPTTPNVPAPRTTETFSGTITANNAHTYPFTSGAGTLTLTLTSVAPDSAIALGVSIGTWSGSACTVGTGSKRDRPFERCGSECVAVGRSHRGRTGKAANRAVARRDHSDFRRRRRRNINAAIAEQISFDCDVGGRSEADGRRVGTVGA